MMVYQSIHKPQWIHSATHDMRIGRIQGLTQDQIAYATQASEAVFLVSKQNLTHHVLEMRMEY